MRIAKLLNAVTAPGVSAQTAYDGPSNGFINLLIQGTASTFSLSVEFSLDGVTWTSVGAAITAKGGVQIAPYAQFFRVNLTAVSGGNITVGAAH